jgi:hypothetical protein
VHLADTFHQQARRHLFQDDAANAEPYGFEHLFFRQRRREDHDAGLVRQALELPQDREAVLAWHPDVENQDIRLQPHDLGSDLLAPKAAPDHLEVLLQTEELLQPVEDDRVIIGKEEANRHVRRPSLEPAG